MNPAYGILLDAFGAIQIRKKLPIYKAPIRFKCWLKRPSDRLHRLEAFSSLHLIHTPSPT
ncbi:hypothetical protein T05_7590 [Trichinella murrelli]|uniref:Uncharacterized protein n=1 Tax=Trichinella murrelli TaxID=144512 RepID=A0A0V0SS16_9BILA|nr:hypothetical protein T05_7590 [Trichinella murrelli]